MREFKDSVTGVQEATKIDTSRSELPPPQPVAGRPGELRLPSRQRSGPVEAPAPAAAPAATDARLRPPLLSRKPSPSPNTAIGG